MMPNNERVQQLLRHNWTVDREDIGDGEIALRITELPNFVVAGTETEVAEQFWGALEGYLEIAVKYDHPLPAEPVRIPPVAVTALPKATSSTANKGRPWAEQVWGDFATV